MSALERYRRVLAVPHVGALWAASAVARLPIGVYGLAIVLSMRHETGSFAAAGVAAGSFAAAAGLTSPIIGRLIDRYGPRRAMPPMVAGHVLTMALFVALLPTAPVWLLAVLTALAGAALPPLSAAMRAMWERLLGDAELISTAFALDAAIVEGVFIAGPLLVALTLTFAVPQVAIVGALVMSVAGTTAVLASPAVAGWQTERNESRGLFGALRSPGLLTVFLATIPMGMAFGAIEIALPAFATQEGHAGQAGLLISMWGVGSMLGALVYGARSWRRDLSQRWLVLNVVLAVGTALPLAAPTTGVMMVLLVPCGACIAPVLASGSQLMGLLAPPGMTTEAYSWGPTAIVGGIASGNAVGGALVQATTWRAAIVLALGAALVSALVGYGRRRTLEMPVAIS
ncbi:MAG: MFS transporter [Solirubrobacteraceae bacterium]